MSVRPRAVTAIALASLSVVACLLNPQPIPPDNGAADNHPSTSADGGGPNGSGGFSIDAGAAGHDASADARASDGMVSVSSPADAGTDSSMPRPAADAEVADAPLSDAPAADAPAADGPADAPAADSASPGDSGIGEAAEGGNGASGEDGHAADNVADAADGDAGAADAAAADGDAAGGSWGFWDGGVE